MLDTCLLETQLLKYRFLLYISRRRVGIIEWHPTAENILVSAGYDHTIIVWDISRGIQVNFNIEDAEYSNWNSDSSNSRNPDTRNTESGYT